MSGLWGTPKCLLRQSLMAQELWTLDLGKLVPRALAPSTGYPRPCPTPPRLLSLQGERDVTLVAHLHPGRRRHSFSLNLLWALIESRCIFFSSFFFVLARSAFVYACLYTLQASKCNRVRNAFVEVVLLGRKAKTVLHHFLFKVLIFLSAAFFCVVL